MFACSTLPGLIGLQQVSVSHYEDRIEEAARNHANEVQRLDPYPKDVGEAKKSLAQVPR